MPDLSQTYSWPSGDIQGQCGSIGETAKIIPSFPAVDALENSAFKSVKASIEELIPEELLEVPECKSNTPHSYGLDSEMAKKVIMTESKPNRDGDIAAYKARIAELEAQLAEAIAKADEPGTWAAARIAELEDHIAKSAARIAELEARGAAEKAKLEKRLDNAKAEAKEAKAKAKEAHRALTRAEKEIERLKEAGKAPKPTPDNSSLSPSNAIGGKKKKEKKDGDKKPKKKGPKKGHKASHHKKLPPDVTKRYRPEIDHCDCGGHLRPDPSKSSRLSQYDLPEKVTVTEHIGEAHRCAKCGKIHKGKIPEDIRRQGLLGVSLVAMLVNLKINGMSYGGMRRFLQDNLKLKLSAGYLSEVVTGAGEILEPAYGEIREKIRGASPINIDETHHKDSGVLLYTWVFVAPIAIAYKIGDRSKNVVRDFLGSAWTGIIGCDYYGAYISYANECEGVSLQHCLAHLKRDFKHCQETLDPEISAYGVKMLALLSKMLSASRAYQADRTTANYVELRQMGAIFNREAQICPGRGKPKLIAERFKKTPGSYTRFIENEGVAPTNNAAELGVRRIVVQRHVTQGTRGPTGRRASELLWSVSGTRQLQGKSFVDYMRRCLAARNENMPIPSIFGD